ncbi:MAG: RidA family protein [Opitutus sp.]|nr:RidA family protein [Opitutus sp.]
MPQSRSARPLSLNRGSTGIAAGTCSRVAAAWAATAVLCLVSSQAADAITRRAQGDAHPGLAWSATTPDVPLALTGQMAGWAPDGKITGEAAEQTRHAIANLQVLLRANGSGLNRVVKLNVCVADDIHHAAVVQAIGAAFANHPVPVSFVRSRLTNAAALVTLDAVAQVDVDPRAVRVANLSTFPAAPCGGHLGFLPAGRRVFLSGYASRVKDFRAGLREVLESQRKTLAHHGLAPADVAHVKTWLAPLDRVADIKEALAEFFGPLPVPPMVIVEWSTANGNEIEFVVAGEKADPKRFVGPLAFGTRPGAEAPTRFSHIAFVEAGQPLIFTAGLYGRPGEPARQQLQDIYAQLGRILFDAGSGFRHLAKATYQNADSEAQRILGEIRDVFYDPARPPAASGVLVHGVGNPGRIATLDMIAVPISKR